MAEPGGWPYRFALIPLDELFVDEAYQRPPSSFFKRIIENYDPAMIGTLITSDRGKTRKTPFYAVIDGQTRMLAMREKEENVAPCLVYEGLTRKQEADLFARLQTERRGMATWIRFRAALISGKAEAGAIAALARSEGFKVAGDGDDKGIRSIAALEWLYRRDLLVDVLQIVGEAWGTVDGSEARADRADTRVRGEILQGIGRFLKDTENVDRPRLVRNLAAITPEQLRHRANALREGSGSSGNYSLFIRDALIGVYATRGRAASTAAAAS
jgi:hypothetical protein